MRKQRLRKRKSKKNLRNSILIVSWLPSSRQLKMTLGQGKKKYLLGAAYATSPKEESIHAHNS